MFVVLVVLPTGAGAPRDFMAPLTCGELVLPGEPRTSIGPPVCPDLE